MHDSTTSSNDGDTKFLKAFGTLLDAGMLVISPDLEIIHSNRLALEFFELENVKIRTERSYLKFIRFLAERGDFGPGHADMICNIMEKRILEHIRPDNNEILRASLCTPSGRRLIVQQISTPEGIITLTAQDKTQELRQEEILQSAMQMGGSGYWFYNVKTGELELNSAYFENFIPPAEMEKIKKKGLWHIIHPQDYEKAKSILTFSPISLNKNIITLRIKLPGTETIWTRSHLRVMKNTVGQIIGVICFFCDVTKELKAEDKIRKAQKRTQESLEAKNTFLAKLSHEIRTPMNAVIGIADALIHHHHDVTIKPKLELIESSAAGILHILDRTLSHSRLESTEIALNKKPENIIELVETACLFWTEKGLANNTTLEFHAQGDIPEKLLIDKFRYEQCINNLLSNAIKFTKNGKIKVILTVQTTATGVEQLVLAIKDSGIGMTQDQMKRIFTPFTQASGSIASQYGGTGLGMSITKEIIEAMNGRISVRSEIGNGSIFLITLPLEVEASENHISLQSSSLVGQMLEKATPEPTSYDSLKVLVVDDNSTNHLVVRSLLDAVVSEIYTANHGREALDVLSVQDVDVILMDIHMPIMDGIEATLAIRSSGKPWANVPIIALTADPEYQQRRVCVNIGMDYALAKPIKLVEILEALDIVQQVERKNAYLEKAPAG